MVLQQPHLVHLGEKGASLLTRFFSVKRGYSLMTRLDYIDRAINTWFKVCVRVQVMSWGGGGGGGRGGEREGEREREGGGRERERERNLIIYFTSQTNHN